MEPLITDWIQAIASIIAVIGAIAAFYNLFKKDKQKQMQIEKLTDIAISLDSQYQLLLTQFKFNLRPCFEINKAIREGNKASLTLKNKAEAASHISYKIIPNNDVNVSPITQLNNEFAERFTNIILTIDYCQFKEQEKNLYPYAVELFFQDRIQNKYSQKIVISANRNEISEPEEIKIVEEG